jgi:putative transposase
MKTLRRYYKNDTDYFITTITYNREPLLLLDIDLFWQSWTTNKPKAWVILPDHFHVIINNGSDTISDIIQRFKVRYVTQFRKKSRHGRVWQNRFWDHIIRDNNDLKQHLDYIHYNPVRHGLTNDPFEYEHSSLTLYHKFGYYQRDWAVHEKPRFEGVFGE